MSRSLGVAAALALAASAVVATPLAATTPGPKQPVEHLGISGAHFFQRTGQPYCYGPGGSAGAGYAVPQGAKVTGATLYVSDANPTANVRGELVRHNFASGGTYFLGTGSSTANGDSTIEISLPTGYVLAEGEAINLIVTIPSSTCLKGGVVHFVRNPGPGAAAPGGRAPAPAPGLAPDAAAK